LCGDGENDLQPDLHSNESKEIVVTSREVSGFGFVRSGSDGMARKVSNFRERTDGDDDSVSRRKLTFARNQ